MPSLVQSAGRVAFEVASMGFKTTVQVGRRATVETESLRKKAMSIFRFGQRKSTAMRLQEASLAAKNQEKALSSQTVSSCGGAAERQFETFPAGSQLAQPIGDDDVRDSSQPARESRDPEAGFSEPEVSMDTHAMDGWSGPKKSTDASAMPTLAEPPE